MQRVATTGICRQQRNHEVQPAPETGGPRHRAGAVGAVRGAGADLEVRPRAPALGPVPSGNGGRADRRRPGPPRGSQGQAARRSLRRLQRDRGVGGDGAPGRVGDVAERDPVRSAARGGALAPTPLSRAGRGRKTPFSPGSRQHEITTRRPHWGPLGDTGAPLPLSLARTRPGGPLGAASRPNGTTTMGHGRSSLRGLGG